MRPGIDGSEGQLNSFEGQPARAFDLPGVDGKRYRLEMFRGRWLLLVLHRHLA